jgi:hypothetical protein
LSITNYEQSLTRKSSTTKEIAIKLIQVDNMRRKTVIHGRPLIALAIVIFAINGCSSSVKKQSYESPNKKITIDLVESSSSPLNWNQSFAIGFSSSKNRILFLEGHGSRYSSANWINNQSVIISFCGGTINRFDPYVSLSDSASPIGIELNIYKMHNNAVECIAHQKNAGIPVS